MRRVWAIFVAVVVALASRDARAGRGLTDHMDLASMAFASDAIVVVTKVSERKTDGGPTLTTVRVTKSYTPETLAAGAVIEVDLSWYPIMSRIDEATLFLAGTQRDGWSAVPAGMRVFVGGTVRAFDQPSDLGGFEPSGRGEGPEGHPYDRAEFEGALVRAMARAKRAHELLAQAPSPERNAKLLDVVGSLPPAPDPNNERDDGSPDEQDFLAESVVRAFAKEKNVDAMLDAAARSTHFSAGELRTEIPPERLLAVATNAAQPTPRRRAAIALLSSMGFFIHVKTPELEQRFAFLIGDREPEIRKAVLRSLFFDYTDGGTPKAFTDAIVSRFAIENDSGVRFELMERARREKIAARLSAKDVELPIFVAEPKGGCLEVAWSGPDEKLRGAASAIYELRGAHGNVTRVDVSKEACSPRGGGFGRPEGHVDLPLTVAPPIEPGTYDLRVAIVIKDPDTGAKKYERTIVVGPTRLEPRTEKLPEIGPPPEGSSLVPAVTAAAPAAPREPPPPAERAGYKALVGAILAILALVVGRRWFAAYRARRGR
jgi:hypothetical protein